MKIRPLDFDLFQCFIGHLDSFRIGVGINFGLDFQPSPGRRADDQIDHYFMAEQGLPPPIHADMAEHPMLDLVPLAGPRREMAHRDVQPGLVGQSLQGHLPQPHPRSVAATTIGSHQQLRGRWVPRTPHLFPPTPQRFHGKLGSVMVGADTHPTHVRGRVVHAIGIGLPQGLVHEVINPHRLGIALRTPFPPAVLEIPNEFLFLRVHRYDWLSAPLEILDPPVNKPELSVPIRMGGAFLGFLIALEAIPQAIQQRRHRLVADPITLGRQRVRQLASTTARPAQRAFRIAPRRRLDQCL